MCYSCYSCYSCASRTSSTRWVAGFSRRTTAEMHPMTLASSGTPSTQPVAVALALLAAILGKYAEGTTDCGFSADHRRNAPHDASVIGDPEHSTCGGGAGASCGDTRQICRGYDRLRLQRSLAAEPQVSRGRNRES